MSEKCKALPSLDGIEDSFAELSPNLHLVGTAMYRETEGQGSNATFNGRAEYQEPTMHDRALGTLTPAHNFGCRRLAAIACVDLTAPSSRAAGMEATTLSELKALRSQLILPLAKLHGGRISELTSHSATIEFPSLLSTVVWAIDLQAAAEQQAETFNNEDPTLRISIVVDDIIDDEGFIHSVVVHDARRKLQAAPPGSILVSPYVRECVTHRLPISFEEVELCSKSKAQPECTALQLLWRNARNKLLATSP